MTSAQPPFPGPVTTSTTATPTAASRALRRFAVLGASGSIARWHVDAIEHLGGAVVATVDPVVPDSSRADALEDVDAFRSVAAFERALAAGDLEVDAVVVCTPNHLHAEHCALALRAGVDVVCEKPVAMCVEEVDELARLERETGRRVLPVLQLREHAALRDLREQVAERSERSVVSVDYRLDDARAFERWRADENQSGGLVFELGIHTLDALVWVYGEPRDFAVARRDEAVVEARFDLARADVVWHLELTQDAEELCRDVVVDGARIDLTKGCGGLHRRAYAALLEGRGPTLWDARSSIALAERVVAAEPSSPKMAIHEGDSEE